MALKHGEVIRTIKGPCFDCDDGDPPCGCGCRFVLPQFACPCHGSVRGTATNPKLDPETRPNVPPRMIAAAEDVLSSAYSTEEVVASIRADGGDPEGIGQRGVAFVKQLLDKRRLAWQEAARQKLDPETRPNVPPRMM